MMNDETEPFEHRVKQQPLRPIPADWRADILRVAHGKSVSAPPTPRSFLSTLNRQLSNLLWPHPKAWATLAAAWVAIAILLNYNPDGSKAAAQTAPPSPELIIAAKQQRRELARLIEPSLPPDAERPKSSSPGPRSEAASQSASA